VTEAWTADPHIASFWKTSAKETAEEPEPLLTALCSNICNEGYGPIPRTIESVFTRRPYGDDMARSGASEAESIRGHIARGAVH